MLELAKFVNSLIGKALVVVVCSHERPDADAIGSQVGFTRYLNSVGVKAYCLIPEKLTPSFYQLVDNTLVASIDDLLSFDLSNTVCVALDCADITRINARALEFFNNQVALNVDHHPYNTNFANVNIVDTAASSTCELITKFFQSINHVPDIVASEGLYGGIIADCGNFLYSSTSTDTLDAAKFLMSTGVKPFVVADKLYSNNTIGRLKLLSVYLSRLELELDGFFAISELYSDDYTIFGEQKISTDGFVNQPLSIGSVQVSAFLDVNIDGSIKGSLRSKWPNIVVNTIAQKFGGGGHKSAAGFKTSMPLDQLKAVLIDEIKQLKQSI